MRTVNRDIICGPDEYTEELSFASRADIQAKAVDWVVNKAGIENVRVDRIYSVRGEDVLEEYNKNVASGGNDIGKPVDDPENPEEIFKDCYWLHMSRYVNGLPCWAAAIPGRTRPISRTGGSIWPTPGMAWSRP